MILFFLNACFFLDAQGQETLQDLLNKWNIYRDIKTATVAIDPHSMDLNDQGMGFYERGQWSQAEDLFDRAIQADPSNAFAYYNAACTLARHYGSKLNIDQLEKIARYLDTAAGFHPFFALKTLEDTDLVSIRRTESQEYYYPGGDCFPALGISLEYNGTIRLDLITDGTTSMGPGGEGDESPKSTVTESLWGFYTIIRGRAFCFFGAIQGSQGFATVSRGEGQGYTQFNVAPKNRL